MHRFSTYSEVVRYLYDSLPMYQRLGAAAYRKDLHNTIRLCGELGNPYRAFKSVHVAGTNGKGSSSHMLASILQEAGYKTGLYTSPHLRSFTERVRVNGAEISKPAIVDFVNRMSGLLEEIKPSFFETTVALAFDYFRSERVDIAVVEVGLGGRLDSTNVITPEVSLITNIGWDHMEILGETLPQIAAEKAGIIKPGIPVVVSERQPETESVFRARAQELGCPIHFAADTYSVTLDTGGLFSVNKRGTLLFDRLNVPLRGHYQVKNLAGVLRTVDILGDRELGCTPGQLRNGLERVILNTHIKGRWQVISDSPMTVCDTAHNVDGMREIVKQIAATPKAQLRMVIGMVKDKDAASVLKLMPMDAHYYFCKARIPRAMDAQKLSELARDLGLTGKVVPSVMEAVSMAREESGPGDMIFVGGSTFVVAEIDGL